ncbi:uncharacterized protein LOC135336615 isoform X1 [Halichondria panicea]|uniref:uncharacterized protein LOC135336615 isoform X1 n=1 Tax=Halichondria panicea TaxID=6063 RepID=UPI00312B46EE
MAQYKELDTLRAFTATLNMALSTLPVPKVFADLLVQNKLVGEMAARNILSPTGIDDYTKASKLMSAVYSHVQTVISQEKATLIFNTLVLILYNDPLGLEDLAQQLVKHRGEGDPAYKTPLPLSTESGEGDPAYETPLPLTAESGATPTTTSSSASENVTQVREARLKAIELNQSRQPLTD